MWFVYIAQLGNGRLYVGHTHDLERRVVDHLTGRGGRTSKVFGFGAVLYVEIHDDESSAVRREQQLKRWSAQKKKALIAGDLTQLRQLVQRRRPKRTRD